MSVTEVPSTVTGVIGEILVKAGDKIKVGQAILTLSGDAAKTEEKSEAVSLEEAVLAGAPSPQHLVEDLAVQEQARANLAEWKK